MKRKRLTRDPWGFGGFPYYQMRVDIEGFRGLVCLIQLGGDGTYHYWDFPLAGRAAVCGKDMTWLQLVPDEKSHVLTAKYLPDGAISVWYADVIDGIEFDTDGVAIFIDKYIDVIFTPQGDFKIDDRDELDAALQSGDISDVQYNAALMECDLIVEEYCSGMAKTATLCDKIMAHVVHMIERGLEK